MSPIKFLPLVALLCLLFSAGAASAPEAASAFDPGLAGFTVEIDGEAVPYAEFFAVCLPNGEVPFRLIDGPSEGWAIIADGGEILDDKRPAVFRWKSPNQPGHSTVTMVNGAQRMLVHMFTMRPSSEIKGGKLNGYRIGSYPSRPYKGMEIYQRPSGFIEVTEDLADVRVGPHFTLGQFLCKQRSSWPKYMVLRPKLILKLEYILAGLNESGREVEGLTILSGYRTPSYNKALGNVAFSRHLWGGAADIYVDVDPADGRMDDWTGDGYSNLSDAHALGRFIDSLMKRDEMNVLVGGLGEYAPTGTHGPFVHVDVRGTRARW